MHAEVPGRVGRGMTSPVPCYRSGYTKAALLVMALLLAGGVVGSHFGGLGLPGIVAFGSAGGIAALAAFVLLIFCRNKKGQKSDRDGESKRPAQKVKPPVERVRCKSVIEEYEVVKRERPLAIWFLHRIYADPRFKISKNFAADEIRLKDSGLLNSTGGLDEEVKSLVKEEMRKPGYEELKEEFALVEGLYRLREENIRGYFSLKFPSDSLTKEELSKRDCRLQKLGLMSSDGSVPNAVFKALKKYF